MIQNSAVSCSLAVDLDSLQAEFLIEELSKTYRIKYNTGLELLTIRHFSEGDEQEILKGKEVVLSQENRSTKQVLFVG